MEIKKLFESREIPDQKISESKLETMRELNNQSMRESGEEKHELPEDGKKKIREIYPDLPDEIIDAIDNPGEILSKRRSLETVREMNNQPMRESREEKYELTEDGKRKIRENYPDLPDEIIDAIDNPGEILSKKRSLETVREMNNQPIQESKEEKHGLTEDEKKEVKEAHPDWPDEIIDAIDSWEEYEVYHKAGLEYAYIDGRHCLIRPDLDLDYIDPKTLKTNRQLIAEGRSPVDPKTGEKIELHHVGQKFDGPLAELTESEHSGNFNVLHTGREESWRRDQDRNAEYNNHQRPDHWKERAKE